MKNRFGRFNGFVLAGLAMCSGMNIVNRFIIEIPEIPAIILGVTGSVLILIALIGSKYDNHNRNNNSKHEE